MRSTLFRPLILGFLSFAVESVLPGEFINGSFESPGNVPSGSFVTLPKGSTTLVGWTIAGPNTDSAITLHHGMRLPELDFLPIDGDYAIIFNPGNRLSGDSVAQTFDTVPGADYEVTFYVGRLGADSGSVSLKASVTSSAGQQLAELVAVPPSHGYGVRQRLVFAATTALSTLFLTDTSTATAAVDLAIDAVSILPVRTQAQIRVSRIDVCWDSILNRNYQVQYRSDMTNPLWVNLGNIVSGTGGQTCVVDEIGSGTQRVYRVLKLP